MSKRIGLLLGVALLAGLASGASAAERPNVVIFLADDLGWADVGFHGGPIDTPSIDRLAREGAELNRFYATPICSPTRAALMTGRDPMKLGVAYSPLDAWDNHGIHPEELFMAEAFKRAGYQTAIFGKWHLGHAQQTYHPNQRGFDHFYGHLHTEVGYFPPFSVQGAQDFQRNGKSVDDEGYETFLLADEAERWIRARDRSRPFFLYMPRRGSFKLTAFDHEWKLVQIVEQDITSTTLQNMLFRIQDDPYEYNDLASQHPEVVADLARRLRDWRLQYPIHGTRVHLVPPPGWRAPRDWATYPIPLGELQGQEAPGYPPSRFLRWVLDRVHRGRGRIIYE